MGVQYPFAPYTVYGAGSVPEGHEWGKLVKIPAACKLFLQKICMVFTKLANGGLLDISIRIDPPP